MPLPTKVRPGDLITADYLNQIIDLLALHDSEIAALQGSLPATTNPVAIVATLPAGIVQAGSEMRVVGHGFGLPSQVTVTLDGVAATLKAGSNDTLLVFDVPTPFNLPTGGRTATLQVSAAAGSAAPWTLYVIPAAPQNTGVLVVTLGSPSSISTGAVDFPVTIQATTSQDDQFLLSATAGSGSTPWAATGITAVGGTPISQIPIPKSPSPGASYTAGVRVTIPANASGAPGFVVLTVTSANNGKFTAPSNQFAFTVGQAPPPPPKIPVNFAVTDPNGNPVQLVPGPAPLNLPTLNVPAATAMRIQFGAALPSTPGDYSVVLSVLAGADKWNPMLPTGTTTETLTQQKGNVSIQSALQPVSGAPDTSLTLTVTSTADATLYGQASFQLHAT
ncbi:MAG TPA: hypothetical protein VFG59_12155 [Anaeromyxobacter sp.]|nr:hypothetical protein [Anaeromyxobacter sp.]